MYLPRDCNAMERELFSYFMTGTVSRDFTSGIYKHIKDPIDKFLVAYVFELGNTQKEAEEALGISKGNIWMRITRIKNYLSKRLDE